MINIFNVELLIVLGKWWDEADRTIAANAAWREYLGE